MYYKTISLKQFVNKLNNNEPFGLARYGDGEWEAILAGRWIKRPGKKRGKDYTIRQVDSCYLGRTNACGCTYTNLLSKSLREILSKNRKYNHGILRIALSTHVEEIENYIEANGIDIDWCDGDIFLNKLLAGEAYSFIKALREKKVLVVGQSFLLDLEKDFFSFTSFIAPPQNNAITARKTLVKTVLNSVEKNEIDVILWSSGMHTKVFLDDVWVKTNGEITQIDCGSMWDGFCGQQSRSYIWRGKILWNDLVEVNTGKRLQRPGETFRK